MGVGVAWGWGDIFLHILYSWTIPRALAGGGIFLIGNDTMEENIMQVDSTIRV